MATLYIDRRGATLDIDDGQLRAAEPEGEASRYPLNGLERVIVSGNSTVSTRLLTHLAARGISLLLVEGRGARRHAFVGAFMHGDATRRLGQYRLCSAPEQALKWSRWLVHARARSLIKLYREAEAQRPDQRQALTRARRLISDRLAAVREAQSLSSLRGMEGAIASAHFEAFAALFAPTLEFSGRNRRPPRDPVNAALSLGYTLTHADAIRACLLAGLDPMLGVLHEPVHGRESLACDLNELVRSRTERLVWRLFAEKSLRKEHFEAHAGGVSLNKNARQTFWTAYEAQAAIHRRQLRWAAAIIARGCQGAVEEAVC